MRMIIVCVLLTFSLILFYCSSNSTSSGDGIEGQYLFVEMWIFSSAKEISGNCDFGDNPATGADYTYNHDTQLLEYTRNPEFPVNEQLKMIFGRKHQFNPLAGAGGTTVQIVPIYFLPDQATSNVYVEGISQNNTVHLSISFKSFAQGIQIPGDSVFVHVIKAVEGGPGEDCIWEYTDSLVVRNYGPNPKSKIIYKPFP